MQLDRNQPAGNGLREALAPWFDHSAAWLVLLCVGLTIFAALTGYHRRPVTATPVALFTAIAATLAAISVAWRASRLRELRSERRSAWRWLAFALAPSSLRRSPFRPRAFDYSRSASSVEPAAVRLLPLRRDGGDGAPALDARQGLRAAVLARGDACRALRRHRALARDAA